MNAHKLIHTTLLLFLAGGKLAAQTSTDLPLEERLKLSTWQEEVIYHEEAFKTSYPFPSGSFETEADSGMMLQSELGRKPGGSSKRLMDFEKTINTFLLTATSFKNPVQKELAIFDSRTQRKGLGLRYE